MESCEWAFESGGMLIDRWRISCADSVVDITADEAEEFKFCPYCGKPLEVN